MCEADLVRCGGEKVGRVSAGPILFNAQFDVVHEKGLTYLSYHMSLLSYTYVVLFS